MKCTKNIDGQIVTKTVTIQIFYKDCYNRNLLCSSSDGAFLPAITVCSLFPPTQTAPVTPPVADFSFSPTDPVVDESVQFTDLSTNNPTSWEWDFGDGDTSSDQDPIHAYAVADTYEVSLTASNSAGSSQHTESVTVAPIPVGTGTPLGLLLLITRDNGI